MTAFYQKYGPLALVAGASEGLGAAWAEALAKRGMDLALVARRPDALQSVAGRLNRLYNVQVYTINADLGAGSAVEDILKGVGGLEVNFLVYNAAASHIGPFTGAPLSVHAGITTVNAYTPMALAHALAPAMLQRGRGGMVFMSSLAGFQGSGFLSSYAATKAFSRILAESLWYEWKEKGVEVIACCAGAVATPNYARTNPGKISRLAPKPQTPEAVVEACLRRIGKMPSFISGRGNRLAAFFMQHVMSRKRAATIMGDTTRKMYRIDDENPY